MSLDESSLTNLTKAFCTAFHHLSTPDHITLRTPTCTHIFLPQSLHIPPKTNDEFAAHLTNHISPYLSAFPVTPQEIHVNVAKRQVTIWATAIPHFKSEAMGKDPVESEWEYHGEYIFILDCNEKGKIERVLEFLDSKETERLRGMLGRARENMGLSGTGF